MYVEKYTDVGIRFKDEFARVDSRYFQDSSSDLLFLNFLDSSSRF